MRYQTNSGENHIVQGSKEKPVDLDDSEDEQPTQKKAVIDRPSNSHDHASRVSRPLVTWQWPARQQQFDNCRLVDVCGGSTRPDQSATHQAPLAMAANAIFAGQHELWVVHRTSRIRLASESQQDEHWLCHLQRDGEKDQEIWDICSGYKTHNEVVRLHYQEDGRCTEVYHSIRARAATRYWLISGVTADPGVQSAVPELTRSRRLVAATWQC